MKRKFFSVLFALVLVLSLGLVMAAPVSAVITTIDITAPTEGELIRGVSYDITWTTDGVGGDTVEISYSIGGAPWVVIATLVPSVTPSASWGWDTTSVPDGENYQVRVVNTADPNVWDISDVFTIDNTAPTFISVVVTDPDEFYKAGDTISFDVDLGETGLTVTADLTVLDSALASNFALSDDGDGTYSGITDALLEGTMVEGVDTAVTITATDPAGNPATDNSLTLTIDKTLPTMDSAQTTSTTTIDVTFSEDLDETTLVEGDFSVADNTVAGATESSAGVVTLTLGTAIATDATPDVTYTQGTLADLAGNLVAMTEITATTDVVSPTVVITSTAPDPTNTSPIPMTATFSEDVTLFVVGDITVGNGTAGAFVEVSAAVYTFDVTATGEVAVTVDIAAGVAEDAANNTNEVAPTFTINFDDVVPSMDSAETTSTTTIDVTFSEDLDDATLVFGDFSVVGNTVTGATELAGVVTLTLGTAIATDAIPNVTYTQGTLADLAGNLVATTVDLTPTDGVSPTVVITSAAPDPTNTSPILMTATFSEAVTGFEVGDITVGNGTADTFAGSGAVYTFEVTASGEVEVTVNIAAGVAIDASSNNNEAAPEFSITYDDVVPTMDSAQTTSTTTIDVTFSEDLDDATLVFGDFSVVGNTVTGATESSAGVVTLTLGTAIATDAIPNVTYTQGTLADLAGNLVATTVDLTPTDGVSPTVVITSAAPDPTNTSPILMTATFSEDVTEFVVGDITVGNGTAGTFAGSGAVYTFEVTASGEVEVTVNIAAGVAIDASSNNNEAAPEFSITYDDVVPTGVTITIADPINSSNVETVAVTITSDEDGTYTYIISDGVNPDVTASGAIEAGVPVVLSLDLSSLDDGEITANASVEDAAGNTGNAVEDTAIKEATAPVVTIAIDDINLANVAAVAVTITSDENGTYTYIISDGVNPDVTASGAIEAGVPVVLSLDLSGLDDGEITANASVEDAAGNTGNAVEDTAIKEATAPVVTITIADPINSSNVETVAVTITSDENGTYTYIISDGVNPDVTASGAIEAGVPVVLSLDLSGLDDGEITANASVEDAAGNTGNAVEDTATKDTGVPVAPVIELTDPINADNEAGVSITGTGEPNATLAYTITDEGVGEVTGAGTVDALGDISITGIDVSTLDDGTLTASVTQTDAALNTSPAGTDEATKDTTLTAPTWKPDVTIYQQDFTVIVTFDEVVTITAATWDGEAVLANLTTADNKEYNLVRSGVAAGTYTLSLTAEDSMGNLGDYSQEFTVETEFDIALYQGLNLISLPLVPVSTDIANVLPVTGVESVWYYDASEPDPALRWLVYHPDNILGSSLFTMQDGKAYWIEMSSPQTMTVTGSIYQAGATVPPIYQVFEGWNMVGFKSIGTIEAATYFLPSEALTWASYSPVTGYMLLTTGKLNPGEGYWVYFVLAGYIVP